MAILRFRFGLDAMVDDTKDKLIAPKISKLRKPAPPDISAERKAWLNALILNFDLSMILSNKNRQFLFNIVRKTEDAFDEYCLGVDNLKDYISAPTISLPHYFSAVRHFEHCLAHLCQATRCMNALTANWQGEKQFAHRDGSVLERVVDIHNAIKHMDERFEKGNLSNEVSFVLFATKGDSTKSIADANVASTANLTMWLTDDGLECGKVLLTYAELAQEIREWCREADNLANIKPPIKKTSE